MVPRIPAPATTQTTSVRRSTVGAQYRADTHHPGRGRRDRRVRRLRIRCARRRPGRRGVRPRRPDRHPASRATWCGATCSRPRSSGASGAGTGSIWLSGSASACWPHSSSATSLATSPSRSIQTGLTVLVLVWIGVIGWVLWDVAEWYYDRFILTNKRVMLIEGIISRRVAMMPLARVTDMKYTQSPLGRVLGYGTVRDRIRRPGPGAAQREEPAQPDRPLPAGRRGDVRARGLRGTPPPSPGRRRFVASDNLSLPFGRLVLRREWEGDQRGGGGAVARGRLPAVRRGPIGVAAAHGVPAGW